MNSSGIDSSLPLFVGRDIIRSRGVASFKNLRSSPNVSPKRFTGDSRGPLPRFAGASARAAFQGESVSAVFESPPTSLCATPACMFGERTPSFLFYPSEAQCAPFFPEEEDYKQDDDLEDEAFLQSPYAQAAAKRGSTLVVCYQRYNFPHSYVADWADEVDSARVSRATVLDRATVSDRKQMTTIDRVVEEEFDNTSFTTLMLRNVPNSMSRDAVIAELQKKDVLREIDFLYLPGETRSKRNVGYCFVNALNLECAERFKAAFEDAKIGTSSKICQIGLAKVQGLQANVDAYLKNANPDAIFQPVLFKNGVVAPFPFPKTDEVEPTPIAVEIAVEDLTIHNARSLMLRNIPNKYTREMLVNTMRERDVLKYVDFFYVPIDLRRQHCVGYCFVNLTSTEGNARFIEAFEGVKLEGAEEKTCSISVGKVQGLESNIEAYRNNAVMFMNERYHPMLFKNGQQIAFPAPTISRAEVRHVKKDKQGVSVPKMSLENLV